jgi:formylglycine-generating enzyme required for sulfatase activity
MTARLGYFTITAVTTLLLNPAGLNASAAPAAEASLTEKLIAVPGGTFEMGDLFDEGTADEGPVHRVTVAGFFLGRHEVTVAEFAAFVEATGYLTSAERFDSREEQAQRIDTVRRAQGEGSPGVEEIRDLLAAILASGGCSHWVPDPGYFDFSLDCNWKAPLFDQSDRDPVVCISWNDAAAYCNWLSAREGLPPAYDLTTGRLLDASGAVTSQIRRVTGYRLPTEAEWEYAARECGRQLRFGNGQDVARPSEIRFDASRGEEPYFEQGERSTRTVPVGSFPPNALGLHEMSGNAWEWCHNHFYDYPGEAIAGPDEAASGVGRVLRGGRWGGTANEARTAARVQYEANNRCNNSGFRIARSNP